MLIEDGCDAEGHVVAYKARLSSPTEGVLDRLADAVGISGWEIRDAAIELVGARYCSISVVDAHQRLLSGFATSGAGSQPIRASDLEDRPGRSGCTDTRPEGESTMRP